MFESVRRDEDYRRRSRGWFSRRQIEDFQEHTKDEDYIRRSRRWFGKRQTEDVQEHTEDVRAEINDEDVRQCSKASYDI